MKPRNCLVTGSQGFIGTHLVRKLIAQGHAVQGYDLQHNQDILDPVTLAAAIKQSDIVFHLAARVDVQESFKYPQAYYHTNVAGTLNVLSSCLTYHKKLIYPSTAAVYQKNSSPYAHSKAIAEDILTQFLTHPITILRLFNVYGVGMNPTTMLSRFAHETPITIYGTTPHTRDFIHVDDVTDIMITAMSNRWNGRSMDVGTGLSYSVPEIASWFQKPIVYKAKREEVEDSQANTAQLRDIYTKPFKNLKSYLDNIIEP